MLMGIQTIGRTTKTVGEVIKAIGEIMAGYPVIAGILCALGVKRLCQ